MTIVAPGVVTGIVPAVSTAGTASARITGGTAPTRVVSAGNATTTQITGLSAANTYKIRVRALDAAGNVSAWSDEIQIVTAIGPTPAAVAAVASIPAVIVTTPAQSPAPATVVAVASVPAITFRSNVQITPAAVAATAGVPTVQAGTVRTFTAAGTSTTATGLSAASNYTARVRARDAIGNWSAWSEPISFSTTSSGSVQPAAVAAVAGVPAATIGGTPPTVTAGRARPVANGQGVALDVTATPPGGATITGYSWSIISGGGSLTNATTATPTYTAPGSGNGLAVIRAAVMTNNAGRATADVTVSYHGTVVAAENALPGTARATWDLASPNLGGISTLQGFCDGFSVNKTGTANFKIGQSDGAGWTAEVFRLGYYNGDGARSYGTITPSGGQITASQAQPTPGDADATTTRLSADAGNWSTTLTWSPPSWVPSGIYILRLNRTGGGASHITFVVRDDARQANLMMMPSDSTWNAYNAWGGLGTDMYTGNSLYYGVNVDQYNGDCARFVSYNRPMVNRGAADSGRDYGAVEWSTFFTGEYPMLRFLERNGLDVKYYSCLDASGDAAGTYLTGNGTTRGGVAAAMFVGHNEYWSNNMRAGWEAARDAGVNIFSCAGNEVFWRTVGTNPDSEGRPRTYECQKSTINGRGNTRPEWTGTWRDPDGTGKGGNNPENKFTGTIFTVNGPNLKALAVPFNGGYASQPIWRHTSVAALTTGQSFTSPSQILGFEWDTYGPAGTDSTSASFMAAPNPRTRYCSDVTYAVTSDLLTDAGDTYGSGNATHRLVVYPASNGGMVFGTGTINWSLGVDDANTYQLGNDNTSLVLQQATINMLVDMGAPPAALMNTLTMPTAVDWYVDVAPATVAATASIPAMNVLTAPAPATVVATAAIPAPTVRISSTFAITTVAATAAVPAAVASAVSGANVALTTITGTAAVPASTVAAGAKATPATTAGTASVLAPSLTASSAVLPQAVAATAAVPTPSLTAGANLTLSVIHLTATAPTVAVSNVSNVAVSVSTVAATATVPAGATTTTSNATVAPATVAATSAVPAVVASAVSSATAGIATVQGSAAVPTPGMRAGSVVLLSGIAAEADVHNPAPSAGGGTTVVPDTVEAEAAIAQPLVTAAVSAVVAATPIAGAASVPMPGVSVAARPIITTVAAVTSMAAVTVASQSGTNVNVGTLAAQAAVPAVAVRAGSSITAQPVSATASVPGVAVRISMRVETVTAVGFVWQPAVKTGSRVGAATVAAKATIPTPLLTLIPVVRAHPHGISVRRPMQSVTVTRYGGATRTV